MFYVRVVYRSWALKKTRQDIYTPECSYISSHRLYALIHLKILFLVYVSFRPSNFSVLFTMPSMELHPSNITLQEASRWRRSFSHRQFQLYPKVEQRLQVGPRESVVDVFLDCGSLQLGPPQRYEPLRAFLEKAKTMVSSSSQKAVSPSEAIAIVDDRCDPTPIVSRPGSDAVSYVRTWTDGYINEPPPGMNVKVAALTAEGLYRHLRKTKKDVYERRIIYATDLSPTMALAIIMNVAYTHLPEIRSYFDRHIGFHPYMKVSMSQGFVLEFHIPHFVLRIDQEARRDERGLRKCRYVQASNASKHRRECIYEAQMSLIVFGVDEFFWTAYFFVDTSTVSRTQPVTISKRS
ncbi:hypothetical protein BJX96DRAFT_6504 [Aspergillus floccosus]